MQVCIAKTKSNVCISRRRSSVSISRERANGLGKEDLSRHVNL